MMRFKCIIDVTFTFTFYAFLDECCHLIFINSHIILNIKLINMFIEL